ncbi:tetratricopeptide repeat protein [Olivibacter sitiensis]|uniref:tetratricopeptide repeat protein n=1 Tax=Olivibacter sitiensis TaxID=376470 RepID=UPI00040D1704|nr:tetratricopeptide repeat protein [Olivibacter sitiensis]
MLIKALHGKFKGAITAVLILLGFANAACAQEPEQELYMDKPTDSIALRRESFRGIGPVPYHLPPRKTDEQLLEDRYAVMKNDAEILINHFKKQDLYRHLSECGDSPIVAMSSLFSERDSLKAENSTEKSLIASIGFYQKLENRRAMSDLQNRLAMHYAQESKYHEAVALFHKALQEKELLEDRVAQKIIIRNIAFVYQHTAAYPEATGYFEQVAKMADKDRDLNMQAEALSHLAQIKAKNNRISEAQNDVIKKIIPLYRRAKNDAGRIEAFQNLASFYLEEKKFTESRWFYLQAVEIASLRNHYSGLATSLYQLAAVKNQIAEYALAITDYKAAEGFALQSKDQELLLKINDGLCKAYMAVGDYGNAKKCISTHYLLKQDLLRYAKQELAQALLQNSTLIAQKWPDRL